LLRLFKTQLPKAEIFAFTTPLAVIFYGPLKFIVEDIKKWVIVCQAVKFKILRYNPYKMLFKSK